MSPPLRMDDDDDDDPILLLLIADGFENEPSLFFFSRENFKSCKTKNLLKVYIFFFLENNKERVTNGKTSLGSCRPVIHSAAVTASDSVLFLLLLLLFFWRKNI